MKSEVFVLVLTSCLLLGTACLNAQTSGGTGSGSTSGSATGTGIGSSSSGSSSSTTLPGSSQGTPGNPAGPSGSGLGSVSGLSSVTNTVTTSNQFGLGSGLASNQFRLNTNGIGTNSGLFGSRSNSNGLTPLTPTSGAGRSNRIY